MQSEVSLVFSSLSFLHIFLPIILIATLLAHAAGRSTASNLVLLAASLVFYMWGIGASFIGILLLVITFNYVLGLWVDLNLKAGRRSRMAVTFSVICNVGVLGYFKYANFFVAETEGLRVALGFEPWLWTDVILPIGISFFTFQCMSYVFDIAAGRARAMKNPLTFALYVALFPQLIAGPIVRYGLVAEQLRERSITSRDLSEGATRFVHGLVKKVIIADSAGAIADSIFALPSGEITTTAAWLGALAYTVQIYFDFSGYSDMAIGLGRMFGFKFPENFNRPYRSVSITDFWRRWHMTLSNWFRDYVYIPLGGSRGGPGKTYVNLATIFVLTGVWHGANWTFLVWGIYNGMLLIIERITGIRNHADGATLSPINLAVRRLIVLLLVLIGWVVFRAPDIGYAMDFYTAMVVPSGFSLPAIVSLDLRTMDLMVVAIGLVIAIGVPTQVRGPEVYQGRLGAMALSGLMFAAFPFALIKVMAGTYSPFLYFQF